MPESQLIFAIAVYGPRILPEGFREVNAAAWPLLTLGIRPLT